MSVDADNLPNLPDEVAPAPVKKPKRRTGRPTNMPERPTPACDAAITERLENRKWRHLTATEWQTIRVIWESGNCTAGELSKRFSVHPETIIRKMKKLGAVKGSASKRYVSQVQSRMQEKINGTADELAERIRETKENFYKWNKTLAVLAMKEIADAKNSGKPMSAITQNLRTYEVASNIVAKTRSETYSLLGLDKDDGGPKELPDLLISEMTADEVEQVRNRMEDEDLLEAAAALAVEDMADDLGDLDDDVDEGDEIIESFD